MKESESIRERDINIKDVNINVIIKGEYKGYEGKGDIYEEWRVNM